MWWRGETAGARLTLGCVELLHAPVSVPAELDGYVDRLDHRVGVAE